MSFVKDTFFGGAEKKAGKAQEKTALAGVEEQRRQFDLTREDAQPFISTGVDALNQQRILLGLGAFPAQQPASQPSQNLMLSGGFDSGSFDFSGFGEPRAPVTIDGATGQVEQPLSALEQQQQAFAAFGESPGQRFIRDRAQKNLLRNASAIGGLGGGNIRSALVEQGVGFAAQDFNNQLNRLAGLSGSGQVAQQGIGALGAQTAGNIQQGLLAAGQAKASGILGQAQGRREGIGQTVQLFSGFSDIRLKENIKQIATLDSGLAVYVWDWNDLARSLVGDQANIGVIAQEAQEIFPDAVTEKGGYLHVNYEAIH